MQRFISQKSVSLLLLTLGQSAALSQQVNVNAGETLTEVDLLSGLFGEQSFTLGNSTVFEINDGGTIGYVGLDPTPVAAPSGDESYFDFNYSTVNLNTGSVFFSERSQGNISLTENVQINLFEGGSIGDYFHAGQGTVVQMFGGTIGKSFRAMSGSRIDVFDGMFSREIYIYSGSTMTFSGGEVDSLLEVSADASLTIHGGVFLGTSTHCRGHAFLSRTECSIKLVLPKGERQLLQEVPLIKPCMG